MPQQEQTINTVVLILVGGFLAIGLFSMLVGQLVRLWDWVSGTWQDAVERAERDMSSKRAAAAFSDNNQNAANSPATTTPKNSNNGIAMPTTERNALLQQGRAEALAAMVKAGKVGETDGIKIVFGVGPSSSNPRYQAAREALKRELGGETPIAGRATSARFQEVA